MPEDLIFCHFLSLKKMLSKFPPKIFVMILLDIIGLVNFLLSFNQSQSRICMSNLHWCYTFCTGVTLELHCSQPIRIEYFFMCIIIKVLFNVLLVTFNCSIDNIIYNISRFCKSYTVQLFKKLLGKLILNICLSKYELSMRFRVDNSYLEFKSIKPLSSNRDQGQMFFCNNNAFSLREIMRIQDMVT